VCLDVVRPDIQRPSRSPPRIVLSLFPTTNSFSPDVSLGLRPPDTGCAHIRPGHKKARMDSMGYCPTRSRLTILSSVFGKGDLSPFSIYPPVLRTVCSIARTLGLFSPFYLILAFCQSTSRLSSLWFFPQKVGFLSCRSPGVERTHVFVISDCLSSPIQ